MALSSSQIDSISRQMYRQFPEIRDARPMIQNQAGAKAASVGGTEQYVLTFRGSGQAPGGRVINRIVRVVADGRGKVLKVSTSR
jgi:hypothetical protein